MNWFLDPYNYVLVAAIFTTLSTLHKSFEAGKTKDYVAFWAYLGLHSIFLFWQLQILFNKP